ncbi:MAG: alkaline phosphatase family protein [Bacteroidota bacterium]
MKKLLFIISCLLIVLSANAQSIKGPKLIVGIVVDQMRPDYLTRFKDQFGKEGFNNLRENGVMMWNVHYNYVPTYTGPGHASIYSGTTPRYHGIIGNDIYYRDLDTTLYCVADPTVDIIGNPKVFKGGFSPHRLLSTNIADELKLFSNKRSKVISLSLKDRAAILPAGHMADYALWFDKSTGNFVSSSFYLKNLPDWVTEFNKSGKADKYSADSWNPLPESQNCPTCIDVTPYLPKGVHNFPHPLGEKRYTSLYESPFANSLLTDLAIEAIKNSNLAKGETPDLLAISYSSTDAVGHIYGPNSKEIFDTYLRLDMDLARLIQALDQNVGRENYVLFLTADHGVADIPAYLKNQKVPADTLDHGKLLGDANAFLNKQYGVDKKWIETIINDQVYLNLHKIRKMNLELKEVENQLAGFLIQQKGIAMVYTSEQMNESDFRTNMGMRVQNGFSPKLSGDLMLILEPGWFEGDSRAVATHGTGYSYDTNAPLFWFGGGIKTGEDWNRHDITDIAPTISMLLHIPYPSACIGNPMTTILK